MSTDESPRLRCLFCAEPLALQDGDYIHDYPAIQDKLLQVVKVGQVEAASLLMQRCERAYRTIDIPPTPKRPRAGLVYSPSRGRWTRPKVLEKVNFFGGIAGTYDDSPGSNQMNAVNSAMLLYFAEEIKEAGRPWNELTRYASAVQIQRQGARLYEARGRAA